MSAHMIGGFDDATQGSNQGASRTWDLDPETEYRFELDPGSSLAIKVRFKNSSPSRDFLQSLFLT